MKAAVIYNPGDIRMLDWEVPVPAADEVQIKIHACGVCGTDNALFKGDYPATYPVIIGHEFSGEVTAVGSAVTRLVVGDRVTVDPNRVCHRCSYCRSGQEHLCENLQSMGVHIHGADAEYCVMLESNVYKFADGITYQEAAFCEPLACAVHGTDLAAVKSGDTVLIHGAGGMGNLITQCVKLSGAANIVVSEPIKKRRLLALENGATHAIDPASQDITREIHGIKPQGADVVIEVAGNTKVQAGTFQQVRKGGTIVFFGCSPKENRIEINPFDVNENEWRILGSFNNQFATGRAVELLSTRKVKVSNLVSHVIPLAEYLDFLKLFGTPESVKLMVSME